MFGPYKAQKSTLQLLRATSSAQNHGQIRQDWEQ